MKVLFITRKFPPSKGGMEKMAHELYSGLEKNPDITIDLVSWRGSNKYLPIIYPCLFLNSFFKCIFNNYDIIYTQDGLLAPFVLLKLFKKPLVITIHGLDITYSNKFYQRIIPRIVSKFDKIICVSSATREECIKRKISSEKVEIIPNGVSLNEKEMHINCTYQFTKKTNIISVGRLVERKGIHWFVEKVIPELVKIDPNIEYTIVGGGPYLKEINKIITEKNLEQYVKLLGRIDDLELQNIYRNSDIFVMPNIPITGDMEGFGIVILEANSYGIPVIASNIEGIKDAVLDGKTGYLIETLNKDMFLEKILDVKKELEINNNLKNDIKRVTLEHFSWDIISKKYYETFKNLTK
jgi:phosphatidylinositol alpha-1,6-mannosyltransferase